MRLNKQDANYEDPISKEEQAPGEHTAPLRAVENELALASSDSLRVGH